MLHPSGQEIGTGWDNVRSTYYLKKGSETVANLYILSPVSVHRIFALFDVSKKGVLTTKSIKSYLNSILKFIIDKPLHSARPSIKTGPLTIFILKQTLLNIEEVRQEKRGKKAAKLEFIRSEIEKSIKTNSLHEYPNITLSIQLCDQVPKQFQAAENIKSLYFRKDIVHHVVIPAAVPCILFVLLFAISFVTLVLTFPLQLGLLITTIGASLGIAIAPTTTLIFATAAVLSCAAAVAITGLLAAVYSTLSHFGFTKKICDLPNVPIVAGKSVAHPEDSDIHPTSPVASIDQQKPDPILLLPMVPIAPKTTLIDPALLSAPTGLICFLFVSESATLRATTKNKKTLQKMSIS